MAATLTETKDELVFRCRGNDLGSQEIVEQHLQAQQLDRRESEANLDTGVQAHS